MMTRPLVSNPADVRGPAPSYSPDWVGRKVRLRAISPADHAALMRFDRATAREQTPQVGGYRHWAAHRAGATDSQLAIENLHGQLLVGSLSTIRAGVRGDRFSYGIGIGPQHRRCGYAGDAIITLLTHMFGRLNYRKCEVSIYGGNIGSLSLHGALGFREEARLRDTELQRGGIRYVVQMGITAHEFAALHPNVDAPGPFTRSQRGRHWRPRRGRHSLTER